MFIYFRKLKKFCDTPIPIVKPSEVILSGFKIILVFGIFYFAIFSYHEPWERIKRDLVEFVLLCFSLFASWLFYWFLTEVYYKLTKKRLFPTFLYAPVIFLIIYSLMVGILYLIKIPLLGSSIHDVSRHFWRHISYGFLIFCIYYYLKNRKIIIDGLIKKVNLSINKADIEEEYLHKKGPAESFITLQVDGSEHKISTSHISHISVDGHYLDICCQEDDTQKILMVRKSLSEILNELPNPPFLRIHRSHIVNLDHISEIKKEKRKFFVIVGNGSFSIPVSRSNFDRLLLYFN